MTTSYTTNLNFPVIVTGEESGTWGNLIDNGLTSYLDIAIAGGLAITITGSDVTLTKTTGANTTYPATNIGSTTAQYAILNISGTKTGNRNLNLPITSKSYIINNAGSGGYLLTVRGVTPTTGVTLVDGEKAVVAWNGSDYVKVANQNGVGLFTNIGLGVTPSAWGSGFNVMEPNHSGSIYGDSTAAGLSNNAYNNGSAWLYKYSGSAADYYQQSGSHIWRTASAGGVNIGSVILGTVYIVTDPGTTTGAQWTTLFSALAGTVPAIGALITCTASGTLAGTGKVTQTITLTRRMGITNNGGVTFGSSATAYGSAGQVLVSQGDAPPIWSSGQAQIQPISASVLLGALTISASALSLDFRSTNLASGAVTTVSGTPANLVVPAGATLGTINNVQSRLIVLAINNAGTLELAVVNQAGGNDLTETGVISTTAISGSSFNSFTIYSTNARTGVAYRVIGYIESTQATAGAWATAPSTIQGAGGEALTAMSSLGYGQTWQALTGSRANAVTYYNTTGRPIVVSVTTGTNATVGHTISVNGVIAQTAATNPNATTAWLITIVPPGSSYITSSNGAMNYWAELR